MRPMHRPLQKTTRILPVLPYAVAFAVGYGIREYISRRCRAAWLERHHQRKEEEVKKLYDQMLEDNDATAP